MSYRRVDCCDICGLLCFLLGRAGAVLMALKHAVIHAVLFRFTDHIEKANEAFSSGNFQAALDGWTAALNTGWCILWASVSCRIFGVMFATCQSLLYLARLREHAPNLPLLQSVLRITMLSTRIEAQRWSASARLRPLSRCVSFSV